MIFEPVNKKNAGIFVPVNNTSNNKNLIKLGEKFYTKEEIENDEMLRILNHQMNEIKYVTIKYNEEESTEWKKKVEPSGLINWL